MRNGNEETAEGSNNRKRKRENQDSDHNCQSASSQRSSSTQVTLQELGRSGSLTASTESDEIIVDEYESSSSISEKISTDFSESPSPQSNYSQAVHAIATELVELLIKAGHLSHDKQEASIQAMISSDLIKIPPQKHLLSSISSPSSSSESPVSPYHSSQSPRMEYKDEHTMPDRGRTQIGPQGEHVSAYSLYEELVLSILDNVNTKKAKEALREGLACLALNDKAKSELEAVYEKVDRQIAQNISKDDRACIVNSLTACHILTRNTQLLTQFFDTVHMRENEEGKSDAKIIKKALTSIQRNPISNKSDIIRVQDAIRTSNRTHLSKLVKEIVNTFLRGANKMDYVSFPSEGMRANPNTGQEKAAKNHLKILSDFLCKLSELTEITTELLSFSIKDKDQQVLHEHFNINLSSFDFSKKSGEKSNEEEHAGHILSHFIDATAIEKIVEKISALFWHPWMEEPLNPGGKKWAKILEEKRYNKGTMPRDNDINVLCHVTARHIVLIFSCFKGLKKLSAELQEDIVNAFLRHIIDDQGWKNERIDIDQLKNGIMRKATINYETGCFSMEITAGNHFGMHIKH